MSDLPPTLVNRLIEDQVALSRSLAVDDASTSTRSVRDFASRKLNSLVPRALSTLDDVMSTGSDKERIAAASKILDKAPATRDSTAADSVDHLPPAALEAITAGLAAFAAAALGAAARPPTPDSVTIIPDSVEVSDVHP